MSDFLTNLALRSIGMAETIMPRLPSLFEPPRMDSNLAVVPGFFADDRDEEVFQQGASASEVQAPTDPDRARRRPPVPDLPALASGESETMKAGSGNQTRRAIVARRTTSFDRVHPPASCRPLDEEENVPISAPKSSFIPESPRSESLPESGHVQGDTIRSATISPDRPDRNKRKAQDGLDDLRIEHCSSIETTSPFSSSQTPPHWSRASTPLLPTASLTQPVPKAIRAVEPRPAPRRPVTGAAVAPRSNPPESVIRVTIGRVEVRAVFSDAPVRRASQAQSRRTLTLDEYLKRSSRGRR